MSVLIYRIHLLFSHRTVDEGKSFLAELFIKVSEFLIKDCEVVLMDSYS